MKSLRFLLFAAWAMIPACREKETVVVTETRPVVAADAGSKWFATSDERFRNAKPSPVKAPTPDGWLLQPSTDIRLLNYRFGQSGTGEVWVSISSGSVLDNVNRWVNKQFGSQALDQAGLDALRKVPVAGSTGVWVEAAGTYSPGMGGSPKEGYGLAGVVTSLNGRILTVKMVGPKADVDAAKSTLERFSASLTMAD